MGEAIADIQDYRAVALSVDSGTLRLDAESDGIKVSGDTWLGRVVAWIKEKISPDPLARTSQEAAHGRFLQAIANYAGYTDRDVSRAEALLATDLLEGKPLSTRRVREVLGELDAKSTETTRQNRVLAEGLVSRIDRRLEELGTVADLDDRNRARLGDGIRSAIDQAGEGGKRALTAGEAMQIGDEAIDAFLKARPVNLADLATPKAPLNRAGSEPAASASAQSTASAPSASTREPRVGVLSDSEPTYVDVSPEGKKKALRDALASVQLPKGAARLVESRINAESIKDVNTLALHSNQAAAKWVNEKLVDGLYKNALRAQADTAKKAGIDIKQALPEKPPQELKTHISKALLSAQEMLPWSETESQAKAMVGVHVAQAVWVQSRDAAGDRLDPESVAAAPRRDTAEPRSPNADSSAAARAAAELDFPADRKSPAEVKRALEGVQLPGDVKSKLLAEIDGGQIRGISDLARRSNQQTTDWVMQNRIQKWYGEGLSAQGAQVGGRLTRTPPGDLLLAVSNHMSGARQLLDYPAVKVEARRIVGSHIAALLATRGRVDPQPVPSQPTAAKPAASAPEPQVVSRRQILDKVKAAGLPRAVSADIEARIRSGEIRSFKELAQWGNRRTAEWALENRFERWYAEGRKEAVKSFDDPARADRLSTSPSATTKYRFSERVAAAPELMAYEAVKDQGRGVVAQHFGIGATRT
ncbi:MAG: hypothetical protein OXJ53_13500 [Gammaproteobacteria bacterium]|nr:hypothetical protein [Gammaproteobacteria bacterium]MDE0273966.1 hypothetical protein [Gammaproteobacteria bacterium]